VSTEVQGQGYSIQKSTWVPPWTALAHVQPWKHTLKDSDLITSPKWLKNINPEVQGAKEGSSNMERFCFEKLRRGNSKYWELLILSTENYTHTIKTWNNSIQSYIYYPRVIATLWGCPSLYPSPGCSVQHNDTSSGVLVFFEAVLWCWTLSAPCTTSSDGVHCT
jgi:hypothetical protein